MSILGIDLGSAHLGAVKATDAGDPIFARTFDVDPRDVGPCVDLVESLIEASDVQTVVVEWSQAGWVPEGATAKATAKMGARISDNRVTMARVDERIKMVCEKRGLVCAHVSVQAWRGRIGIRKPTPPGGSKTPPGYLDPDGKPWRGWLDAAGVQWFGPRGWHDATVKALLVARYGAAVLGPDLLADEHRRDALGAVLGYLARPVVAKRTASAPGTEAPRRAPVVTCAEPSAADRVVELLEAHGRRMARPEIVTMLAPIPSGAVDRGLRAARAAKRIRRWGQGHYAAIGVT